jgi:hypothetical protein
LRKVGSFGLALVLIAAFAIRMRMDAQLLNYDVWHAIRGRCNNPNRHDYHLYGGRGVCCDLNFEEFFAEVGPRPSPQHYLVLKDKNGDYVKSNMKWVPLHEWRRGKPLSPELRLKYQKVKAITKLTGKRTGTSRFIGVCWFNADGFWHAQIAIRWSGKEFRPVRKRSRCCSCLRRGGTQISRSRRSVQFPAS